eukprot:TRINITY_DN1268_c0_g1_i2.p1 TRINITY_DN1268_c0_g1~~TRINITY_DN1268_c0_g1_i2.p1  ORF type:complete len:158 (+),score=36.33 TRINITY_DN1268_c0_g1_i2:68-541(+)
MDRSITSSILLGTGAFLFGYSLAHFLRAKETVDTSSSESSSGVTEDTQEEESDSSFAPDEEYKMILAVRTDLKMQKGKMCAQCGHAALGVYRKAVSEKRNLELKSWLSGGQAKIALQCKGEAEMLLLKEAADKAGVLNYCVADAGKTVEKPPESNFS